MGKTTKRPAPRAISPAPLIYSEDMFRVMCDRIPALIAVYDIINGEYYYINDAIKDMLGYQPTDFLEGGIEFAMSLVHPDDAEKITTENAAALKRANAHSPLEGDSEVTASFEYRMRHANGHYVWLRTEGSVLSRVNGQVRHLLNASIDISSHKALVAELAATESKAESAEREVLDRREMEEKLRASEERYQAFIHNSSEGIWLVELEKPIPISLPVAKQIKLMYKYAYLREANEAMARMYGIDSVDDILGARLGDLLVESDPANIAYLTAFIEAGYKLADAESHELDSNGRPKYFLNSLTGIIEDGYVKRAWGTQRDITRERIITKHLEASEDRLSLALQASRLGTWEWDVATGDLMWSDQLKRLFGLKKSDTITYEKYMSLLHPDDRVVMQQTIQDAIDSKTNYQVEHRVFWPDGTLHWLQGQGQAVYEDGIPTRMIGTTLSIDERKQADELKIEAERLLAERTMLMELSSAKDEFISIASHQLRTPASSVKQYIGMLLGGFVGELHLTDKQREMLEAAYNSNERQIRIIDDLLQVARVDAGKVRLNKEMLDAVQLARDVVTDMQRTFEARLQSVTIKTTMPKIPAFVDRMRLRMVLENLLDNASKYSPNESTITINVKQTNDEILLSVSDKGVGISAQDQKRLFQKFSRLENPLSWQVGGSGLGLYWVQKIIDLHGGSVSVKSKPKAGATFTISLPNKPKKS